MPQPFVALVTGASTGIGEATARRLAREPGARLVLAARREQRLRALADELGGATVVAVDLTSPAAPETVRDAIEREHGGELHLLVNNAGAVVARELRRRRLGQRRASHEAQLRGAGEADRGAAAAAARNGRRGAATGGSRSSTSPARPPAWLGPTRAHIRRASSRSWAGATRCTPRRPPTGSTSDSCCPASWPPKASRPPRFAAKAATRWLVAKPATVAEAIVEAGPGGKAERYDAAAIFPGGGGAPACAGAGPARHSRRRVYDRQRLGPISCAEPELSYAAVSKATRV